MVPPLEWSVLVVVRERTPPDDSGWLLTGATAVVDDAVVDEWESGDGVWLISWLLSADGFLAVSAFLPRGRGWPYCTSCAVNERGNVCAAFSHPATAGSRPEGILLLSEVGCDAMASVRELLAPA